MLGLAVCLQRVANAEDAKGEEKVSQKAEIIDTLLLSYEDGMHFLQGTVEETLETLGKINELNNKTFKRAATL